MKVKLNTPIEVSREQYYKIAKSFGGGVSFENNKDGYFVTLTNAKFKEALEGLLNK